MCRSFKKSRGFCYFFYLTSLTNIFLSLFRCLFYSILILFMRGLFFATCLASFILTACSSNSSRRDPIHASNVRSDMYANTLSQSTVPVTFYKMVPSVKGTPTRFLYTTDRAVMYDNQVILPAGSTLSSVIYYRDSPHLAIDLMKLPGNVSWTPAQGVLSRTTETKGFATLSSLTVPK